MRIVSGRFKGYKLVAPEGLSTRPTKEMVREALFSALGNIHGSSFLDLFAGSGAMGLEAYSRGASVYLNDIAECSQVAIYQNLAKLKIELPVQQKDACEYLRTTNEKYDVIFCDPPYAYKEKEQLFSLIHQRKLLRPQGILIYEEHRQVALQEKVSGFCLNKLKEYGISRILFYQEEKE